MSDPVLAAQLRVQDALSRLKDRATNEHGEIGSQLILMGVLVTAAVVATTALGGPIKSLIESIGGKIK
jgi:hypothetical protein